MKNRPITYFLFFMQYIFLMIFWYWLFVDVLWLRLMSGIVLIGYSILATIRRDLFPIRTNLMGREFPERVVSRTHKYTSWLGIPMGVLVLFGYRVNKTSHLGIVGLVFFVAMAVFYILWIKTSKEKERAETKRFWVFAFIALILFIAMNVLILLKGPGEISLFKDYSPYPMMIAYLLMGIWHLIVVLRKDRHYA